MNIAPPRLDQAQDGFSKFDIYRTYFHLQTPFITATTAKMTKRTKKVGVTGKYGTRYAINLLERKLEWTRTVRRRIKFFRNEIEEHSEGRIENWRKRNLQQIKSLTIGFALQIRCFSAKAGQEDGNHTTCQIRLHILRKDHRQASLSRHLELQVVQQDCRWRSLHCLVCISGIGPPLTPSE